MNKRIYLSPPHLSGAEQGMVEEAFASNWIAPLGPHVDAFEKELASYLGVKGALALNSGTSAIHLAVKLLNLQKGDLVLSSSLTFIGSVNPILYEGGEPVFIDSEPTSWNISPQALERAISDLFNRGKRPKAVIFVNLYGQNADMTSILEIADRYGIPIIEDAAESLGATYKGKASGSFGKYGILSFNGNKIITTSGGGALVSDDLVALEKARFWATQAKDPAPYYQHSEVGYNYRLSNISAAVGRAQLQVIEDRIDARRKIFQRYYDNLADVEGIEFMPEIAGGRSTRWLTALAINPKLIKINVSDLIKALADENIESRHIWKPMHLQPIFKGNSYYPHDTGTDVSQQLFTNGICLPSGSNLSEAEQLRVIDIIHDTLS